MPHSTDQPLSIGFSPCPNDTFIFNGLVHGLVNEACPAFAAPLLEDVETLNLWALEARLDVTKLSFHALGHAFENYVLLGAGSALGRGCGPLLVVKKGNEHQEPSSLRIAIPGQYTTAAMLLRLYQPACKNLVILRFEEIMPAVARGEVDAGVIIHESRFTFQEHGLALVQDLGAWWEESTGHPIPLGGIVARRSLGKEKLLKIDQCIRQSVQLAFAAPDQAKSYIHSHAQELDENVIQSHIALYVNTYSEDLGPVGMSAVRAFLDKGQEQGIFPADIQNNPLSVYDI